MTADDGTLDLFAEPEEEGGEGGEGEAAAAASETPVWTVSELNAVLRRLLETSLAELWVAGEVTNWTRARSGHCYFTLKDEAAQLRCVMWRREAIRLPTDPEEGMALRVRGRVTMYESRGMLQLQVLELQADGGEGLWKLAFERLRLALEQEGLLRPERKRPLPPFPRTVGVVTSTTGAALRDVLSVIGRRAPWTRVLVRGTRVQGEGSAAEIAAAIRVLGASGRVDVLVVGRGGGSIEDLWAFNEEPVARAIAACPVPVVSAVGHETDVTISDLVADLRAPTPSAAAEAVVQDRASLLEVLDEVRPRLARALRSQADQRRVRLREGARRLEGGVRGILEPRRAVLHRRSDRLTPALRALLAPRRVRLDRLRERLVPAMRSVIGPLEAETERARERLERGMRETVRDRRGRLATAAGRVEALSPLSTLRRGYAVPLGPDGRVLRAARDFEENPRFRLRVVDGRIECETREIRSDEVSK